MTDGDSQKDGGQATPKGARTPRRRSVGGNRYLPAAIIAVILALLTLMMAHTEGRLTHAHRVLLYVGVALLTGVIFWTVTESEGAFTAKVLGIKLGGGPPRFVRAVLYDYRFSTPEERRQTGAWWVRELEGTIPLGPQQP